MEAASHFSEAVLLAPPDRDYAFRDHYKRFLSGALERAAERRAIP